LTTLTYDALVPNLCPSYNKALAAFAERSATASSVFELGIGTGNVAQAILVRKPLVRYAGCDIDEASIEIARQKLAGKDCSFLYGDFRAAQLPSVDAVVSSLSIHHLSHEEQKTLLRKIYAANRQFLHFELIAPEDEQEKRLFEEFDQHIIREQAPKYGIPMAVAQDLHKKSQQNDNPMKLSEHIRIHREFGVKIDVVFKDGCFVFYEGRSDP
jgi:SAM-dependent methyltransferase